MGDFFNWHDTWILVEAHWIWMLVAAAIGCFVGWWTCETVTEGDKRP